LIISRKEGGPDAAFSLEPDEFSQLVKSVREVEKAIGKSSIKTGKGESENIIFRKSLFVVRDINKGEKFTKNNVRSIRPGYGLSPKYFDEILKYRAKTDVKFGTPLSWKLIDK
jgi:pseudaminic acid synthase